MLQWHFVCRKGLGRVSETSGVRPIKICLYQGSTLLPVSQSAVVKCRWLDKDVDVVPPGPEAPRLTQCGHYAPPWNWEQNTHGRSYRDKVWSWDERMNHLETAISRDPSHNQGMDPLHILARFCWKDPDRAVSCETLPGPSKHRIGCS